MGGMKWDTEKRAADYDDQAVRAIPGMDLFYSAVTDVIPPQSRRVLELGCGTGILTTQIRKTRPETALVCIDNSAAMLAVAREKSGLAGVTLMKGDIRNPWPTGPYDAVVSTFCLPVLEPDEQQAVLKRAYHALRDGGVCITGCVARPPTAEEEQRQLTRWEGLMQDAGLDPGEVRRQRASWDEARARIPTVDGFREMLAKAGFTRMWCPYHAVVYAVFVGVR
jgi:tRNA (cmo5U34)-methyltransferase